MTELKYAFTKHAEKPFTCIVTRHARGSEHKNSAKTQYKSIQPSVLPFTEFYYLRCWMFFIEETWNFSILFVRSQGLSLSSRRYLVHQIRNSPTEKTNCYKCRELSFVLQSRFRNQFMLWWKSEVLQVKQIEECKIWKSSQENIEHSIGNKLET